MHVNGSPSHTVGLERNLLREGEYVSAVSPSHTVGLERGQADSFSAGDAARVTIPHGGLGTVVERHKDGFPHVHMSPSHTVGLELGKPKRRCSHGKYHHPTRWARNSMFID